MRCVPAMRFLSWRMAASTAAGSSPRARTGSPWRASSAATCSAVPAARPAELLREAQRGDQADRDALAVREAAVARDGLDPVADGVPEVEDRTPAAFLGVGGHDQRLHARAALYELAARGAIADARLPALDELPQPAALEQRRLDDLGHAARPLACRQRLEQLGVAEHGARLPEGPDVVLGGDVDRGLAADRRVHLTDQRGRHGEPLETAPEGCGRESADIGHGAAAGAHDHVAALQLALGELAPQALQRGGRLGLLPPSSSIAARACASDSARSTIATAPRPSRDRRSRGASRPAAQARPPRSRPSPPRRRWHRRWSRSPGRGSHRASRRRPGRLPAGVRPARPRCAPRRSRTARRARHRRRARAQAPASPPTSARHRPARSRARRRAAAARASPPARARGRPPRRRARRARAPSSLRAARPRSRHRRSGVRDDGRAAGRPCSCRRP